MNQHRFYVYCYSDPRTHKPFYIGKGTGRRMRCHTQPCYLKEHTKFYRKLRGMAKAGIAPIVTLLSSNLTDQEALDIEADWIKAIGKGNLTNLVDRGRGASGFKRSKASREKQSRSMKGRVFSVEHRKHLADAQRGVSRPRGKANPNFGRIATSQCRNNIAAACSYEWVVIFPDGREENIRNLKGFCRDNALDQKSMWSVANGKQSHHKHFKARYGEPQ